MFNMFQRMFGNNTNQSTSNTQQYTSTPPTIEIKPENTTDGDFIIVIPNDDPIQAKSDNTHLVSKALTMTANPSPTASADGQQPLSHIEIDILPDYFAELEKQDSQQNNESKPVEQMQEQIMPPLPTLPSSQAQSNRADVESLVETNFILTLPPSERSPRSPEKSKIPLAPPASPIIPAEKIVSPTLNQFVNKSSPVIDLHLNIESHDSNLTDDKETKSLPVTPIQILTSPTILIHPSPSNNKIPTPPPMTPIITEQKSATEMTQLILEQGLPYPENITTPSPKNLYFPRTPSLTPRAPSPQLPKHSSEISHDNVIPDTTPNAITLKSKIDGKIKTPSLCQNDCSHSGQSCQCHKTANLPSNTCQPSGLPNQLKRKNDTQKIKLDERNFCFNIFNLCSGTRKSLKKCF